MQFPLPLAFAVILLATAGCTTAPQEADSQGETVPPISETVPPEATAAAPPEETAPTAAPVTNAPAPPWEFYTENGIAGGGADPVAYFTQAAYVPGTDSYTHDWAGATWQFASAENRDAFAREPDRYAPQYGGYCAWAVSQGYTAPIDPTAWKVVDGKLYLNVSPQIQARWERDIPGHIAQADANWPQVLEQ